MEGTGNGNETLDGWKAVHLRASPTGTRRDAAMTCVSVDDGRVLGDGGTTGVLGNSSPSPISERVKPSESSWTGKESVYATY